MEKKILWLFPTYEFFQSDTLEKNKSLFSRWEKKFFVFFQRMNFKSNVGKDQASFFRDERKNSVSM
jgi:hypothetical protein